MIIRRAFGGWPVEGSRSSFDELERVRRQLDDLLERGFGTGFLAARAGVFPLTNVTESPDRFTVRAELPGIKPGELQIAVVGRSLSLSGDRKIPRDEAVSYHRSEREEGGFSRTITLPADIDSAKVEATCSNGVLTITLPKAEAAKPKQITIKAG